MGLKLPLISLRTAVTWLLLPGYRRELAQEGCVWVTVGDHRNHLYETCVQVCEWSLGTQDSSLLGLHSLSKWSQA